MSDRAASPRSLRARLAGALATGVVIAFWLSFAPISIGGDFSYVAVNGNSMEPHLRTGDIAILRREDRYGIGEVVAYRDPAIGAILHRIRGRDGERYVVQGDNRERADAYAPLAEDILGREVFVVSHALAIVMAVTSPLALGALTLAVISLGLCLQLRAARARPRYRHARGALAALRACS